MKIDWDRTIQSAAGFGFNILNVKVSRFPKLTIWLGNLAGTCEAWAYWVALPIGPLRLPLRFLVVRSTHARLAAIPLSKRLMVAGAGALLTGLMDAFQQLFPEINISDNRSTDEMKGQIERRLKDQVAQKEG